MAPKNQARDSKEARERLRLYKARQGLHDRQRRRRLRDNLVAPAVLVLVAALATGSQLAFAGSQDGGKADASATATSTATPTPSASATAANTGEVPSKSIAKDSTWTGSLTLNKDVRLGIELDGKKAPQATSVEVKLIQDQFYNGTTCHRLADSKGFAFLQCGSANGDGTGDAGFEYGPLENVPSDGVYEKGTLAIARGATAYSQSTQFFIVFGDTTLDGSTGGYTVVGKVTSGLDDLVSKITSKGVSSAGDDGSGAPKVATKITGATIEREK
ncbi:peptidyl-prolyl cis-trans isomerase B (cyclophilin B) [Curtobacterium flaccumfaciens]|uniref:peptidylprolyl isomerase n=1 Tax=Curtobacterium flaccumfaciens TaxID=2035 RepID=A0A4R6DJ95_9MICO|nr:peptidylprolyl isomerase [Curtobacterium flaccumfaciens]TDN44777.1 peptidyl-prolyl cis-trans isomerase B (cyclophilin B) [Curtobacterium flaccumfaciens]